MMGKTHQAAAVTVVLLSAPHISEVVMPSLPVSSTLILAGAAMIGALLPDGDTPRSKLGRKLFFLLFPYYLLQWFVKLLSFFIPRLKKVSKVIGHRGIAHDPCLWLTFSLPFFLYYIVKEERSWLFVLIGLMIGILSHLFLDYLSGGIPVYLFKKERLKAPIYIETGSVGEMIIFFMLVVIDIVLIKGYLKGGGLLV